METVTVSRLVRMLDLIDPINRDELV
jgi:hypothetical protein